MWCNNTVHIRQDHPTTEGLNRHEGEKGHVLPHKKPGPNNHDSSLVPITPFVPPIPGLRPKLQPQSLLPEVSLQ